MLLIVQNSKGSCFRKKKIKTIISIKKLKLNILKETLKEILYYFLILFNFYLVKGDEY
jgi:uncharacterized protein (UPF0335 family)